MRLRRALCHFAASLFRVRSWTAEWHASASDESVGSGSKHTKGTRNVFHRWGAVGQKGELLYVAELDVVHFNSSGLGFQQLANAVGDATNV